MLRRQPKMAGNEISEHLSLCACATSHHEKSIMGVGKGRKRVVVDRGDRTAMVGQIEGKSLAGVERAVRLLSFDGLGQLAVVEGDRRIMAAVGGVTGHSDIVEREIVDLLRRASSGRLQPDEFHTRDVFAGSRVLEQGNKTPRLSCDVDHQRIELRLAATAAGATIGEFGQFVKSDLVNPEVALKTLDG